jgi:predicted nucleotidyltransferase
MAELDQKLAQYAREQEIIALYLFGSAATGTQTPLSDIDIAVLLPEDIPVHQYFDRRLQMTLDLMQLLGANEVDLVILNQAPPLLKHQVISHGKVIYCRDEPQRRRFEARAILEYLDFKPILDLQFEYLKRRLREGKFGVRSGQTQGP